MDHENSSLPILLKINSTGGEIASGIAIYDSMQQAKAPVHTYCVGQACSMASLILSGGQFGKRHITRNSFVMIHEPSGLAFGKTCDIRVSSKHLDVLKCKLITLYSQNTRNSYRYIESKLEGSDHWMDADQAKEFGLVDQILPY